MSAPRFRVEEDRVEVDVAADAPRGALVLSSKGYLMRIAIGERTIAWGRALPQLRGVAWARVGDAFPSLVPPIRSRHARSDVDWRAFFARSLSLGPGTWGFSEFHPQIPPHVYESRDREVQPMAARLLACALTLPAAFVEPYRMSGSQRVVPLRSPSPPDAARVKAWRKHARDGTLPPMLALWVSGLDLYVLLDGHDRLLAALLERVTPGLVGAYAIGESRYVPTDEDRDRIRDAAMAKYRLAFANEPRLSLGSRLELDGYLAGAWNDFARRHATTIARYDRRLDERLCADIATLTLPDDVRDALMR